jgi:outer membrane receptor protein involved in Fe transport
MLGNRTDSAPGINRTMLASTISALLAGTGAAHAQDQGLEEITVTGSRIVRRDLDAASPIVTVGTERLENSSTVSIESVLNQMPQFVPEGTQFDSGNSASGATTLGIASVNLRGIGANRTLVLVDGRRAQPANASLVVDLNTIPSAAIERIETITGGASAVYGADALAGVVNFVLKDDFEGVEMDFQTSETAQGDGQETKFSSLFGVNGENGGNVMVGVEWYRREAVYQVDRDFFTDAWADRTNQTGGFLNYSAYSPGVVTVPPGGPGNAGAPIVYGPNAPTQAAINALFAPYGIAAGQIRPSDDIFFQADGRPFISRSITGVTGQGTNYTGPLLSFARNGDGTSGVRVQPNGALSQVNVEAFAATPAERRSVFGRAHVDINDNLSAFAQATYSTIEVATRGNYPPAITVWQAQVPNDGLRTIPAELQALLNGRPRPTEPWNAYRGIDYIGGPIQPTSQTDAYQLLAGVEGSFANSDWTWDAYVSTGETNITMLYDNLPSLQRYQFLMAQPNWGAGTFVRGRNYEITCSTGLPMFGQSDDGVDPGCIEGIESKDRALWDLTQNIVEANLQGKVADMKNGELRFAAGVATRENKFSYDPGTNNDNIAVVEQPLGIFLSNNTSGSTDVSELYGELLLPATERLNIELGYRYSDYDTAGGVNTYKTLFDWSTTNSIRVRGGYQFATRAPNTEELFAGPRLSTVNDFIYGDPCQSSTTAPWGNRPALEGQPVRDQIQALCRALIGNSTSQFDLNPLGPDGFVRPDQPFFQVENEVPQGNAKLGVEEAKTWTLGAVFTSPGGLENLTASVDFYSISITDAIATLDATFVYSKCLNADGTNPTYDVNNSYCQLIARDPISGQRSSVDAPYLNSGNLETRGIDLAANWTKDIGDNGGSFSINSLLTYLDQFEIQDSAQDPVLDVRDTLSTTYYGAQYKYKLNNTFGYSFPSGKVNVGLMWRYLPAIRSETATRVPNTTQLGADSYNVFSTFAQFAINEKLTLRGGIDNLTDEDPVVVEARPGIDSNTDVTRPDYYDTLGRRFYVGLKMSF